MHRFHNKGWEKKKEVKIIFEELFYNKEYKPFRVLCISSPLEGGTKVIFLYFQSVIENREWKS